MGISFSSLVQNEATVKIDVNGNDLNVSYVPKKLSPAFMDKLSEDIEEDDPLAFARLFCEIVTGWDLEGPLGEGEQSVGVGEQVPLEPEIVAWIPGSLLRYIVEQVGAHSAPKSMKKSRR